MYSRMRPWVWMGGVQQPTITPSASLWSDSWRFRGASGTRKESTWKLSDPWHADNMNLHTEKARLKPGIVAHTCNHNDLGSRDQEDSGLRSVWAKH
jgi:hypothetical protein